MNMEELAHVLRAAARAEILPRFRRLGPGMIHEKTSSVDLVTEADQAAERMIAAEIAKLMPDGLFVGEESVAADPALLDRLWDVELAVVVDPIDGTANFAAGLPLFSVMAAVVVRGETVAGVIYDPMGDDWVLAEKGGGAWLRRPDGEAVRLKGAAPVPLEAMQGVASLAYLPRERQDRVYANFGKVLRMSVFRGAGHEYRLLAGGHIHFAMFNKLMPWDHLAGALIAEEAGARVARFDGSRYRPEHLDGGLLLAPDRDAWEALRREVFVD